MQLMKYCGTYNMASSFYDKVTSKVSGGSGASGIAESIDANAESVGDALKEQQAAQDYTKSQAKSELGQQLTSAAGDALKVYGEAVKEFKTTNLANVQAKKLNDLKAEISAETNPARKSKLIKAAMEDGGFMQSTRAEFSKLGYGGSDLEERVGAIQSSRQGMLREQMKSNVEEMSKVEQEIHKQQVNLITNSVSRDYRAPLIDSKEFKDFEKLIDAKYGKDTIKSVSAKRDLYRSVMRAKLEKAFKYKDADHMEKVLKSGAARQFLEQGDYSKYEKMAEKLRGSGETPVTNDVKGLSNLKMDDAASMELVIQKISSDTNISPQVRGTVSTVVDKMKEGLAGDREQFLRNGDIFIKDLIKEQPKLNAKESSVLYDFLHGKIYKGLKENYRVNPDDTRQILGKEKKGFTTTQMEDFTATAEDTFETKGQLPVNQNNHKMTNQTTYKAAAAGTVYGENHNKYRTMNALLRDVMVDNPIKQMFKTGNLGSHVKEFNGLYKDKSEYTQITEGISDKRLTGKNKNADPDQMRYEAALGALINMRHKHGVEWDSYKYWEKQEYVQIEAHKILPKINKRQGY